MIRGLLIAAIAAVGLMAATPASAQGIYFGEGPRWHDGRLWFSDFHAHAVKSV